MQPRDAVAVGKAIGLRIFPVGGDVDLRHRLAVLFAEHGDFQQRAALRRDLHITRDFSGFDGNRHRLRDPFGIGVGAEDCANVVTAVSNVGNAKRAVRAGFHKLKSEARKISPAGPTAKRAARLAAADCFRRKQFFLRCCRRVPKPI